MSAPTESPPLALDQHLLSLLPSGSHTQLRTSIIPTLLRATAKIADALRTAHTVTALSTSNPFGDAQLSVDVLAERLLRDAIAACPAVRTASSEEDPVERPCQPEEGRPPVVTADSDNDEIYTLAFDPLDGSSIITPNWTVGSIIGIWLGSTALHQDPSTSQIASILTLYGPRATALVAIRPPNTPGTCFEVALPPPSSSTSTTATTTTDLTVIRPRITLNPPPHKTRYFAPANLRAAASSPRYLDLVNHFIRERYTLRYSGGLVPDVAHALSKGHGVYVSPVSQGAGPKLRRLFEGCPVALVVECAGGKAVEMVVSRERADGDEDEDGDANRWRDVLSCPVEDIEEKAGLLCGSAEEVEMVRQRWV